MSLTKLIQTEYGVAAHWVVEKLAAFDPAAKIAIITVNGYQDDQAKNNGLKAFATLNYAIENSTERTIKDELLTLSEIKELNDYILEEGELFGKSDTELMARGLYKAVNCAVEKNYFNAFEQKFNNGQWIVGAEEFLLTNTEALKIFAGAEVD